MELIRFKPTEQLTDKLEKVSQIWYGDVLFGFKFIKSRYHAEDRVWYRLICALDTIEKCEKKFGYGWKIADCGYEIYPEDGNLSLQQIESELLPEVIRFIIEQEGYDGLKPQS